MVGFRRSCERACWASIYQGAGKQWNYGDEWRYTENGWRDFGSSDRAISREQLSDGHGGAIRRWIQRLAKLFKSAAGNICEHERAILRIGSGWRGRSCVGREPQQRICAGASIRKLELQLRHPAS